MCQPALVHVGSLTQTPLSPVQGDYMEAHMQALISTKFGCEFTKHQQLFTISFGHISHERITYLTTWSSLLWGEMKYHKPLRRMQLPLCLATDQWCWPGGRVILQSTPGFPLCLGHCHPDSMRRSILTDTAFPSHLSFVIQEDYTEEWKTHQLRH